VVGHPQVRTILLLFAIVGIFGWSYAVLMPAFARDILHLGASGYGVLMAASGTGALCGALSIAAFGDRTRPRIVALSGVWIFAAALMIFATVHHFIPALISLWFAGFGMMLFFSTANTVLQTVVPDEMRGRVMGVWALVFGAMIPLGSLEVGLLAPWIGSAATLQFGAAVCALAALVTLVLVRRREARAAVSNPEAAVE
jgi:predicted MFS family arabinose efflux permease